MLTKLGQCALLAVLIALAFPASANAQSKSIVKDSVFERLTTNDGLPQQTIYDLAQDSFGFLWVATEGGLARYDGKEFRVWKPSHGDAGHLSSGYIKALAMGADHALWVGTGDSGLDLLNVSTMALTHFGKEQGLAEAGINDLFLDSLGKLWIGYDSGEVQIYDPASKKFTDVTLASDGGVGQIAAIAQVGERVWIAQADLGAWHTNLTGSDSQLIEDSSFKISALAVHKSDVWVGSATGVQRYAGATGDELPVPKVLTARLRAEPRVQALNWSSSDELWVGLADGLLRLRSDGSVSRYESHIEKLHELSFPSITAIFEDSFKNMWFGTSSNGLNLLDTYKERLGFVDDVSASGTAHYTTDTVHWVGTYPGSLNRVDRKSGEFESWRTLETEDEVIDLSALWITSIVLDAEGRVWMSTDAADVIVYDPASNLAQFARPELDENVVPIWRLEKMRDGRILAATWGQGVLIFDPTSMTVESINSSNGLSDDRIYVVQEDVVEDGVLWIGGAPGLVKYALAKDVGEVWDKRYVTSMDQDRDGTLWAGTSDGGLLRVTRDKVVTAYDADSDNGLTDNTIYGVLEDSEGRIWVSTNGGGLCFFKPTVERFFCFGNRDGALNEYAQNSSHRAADGTLYFGGPGGFNEIDSAALSAEPGKSQLSPIFLKLMVENKEVIPGAAIWTNPAISLNYGESTAALEFAAPKFEDNERVQFEYRIKGFSKKWYATSRRFIPIPNLGGGDYEVQVRVADRFGNWSDTMASIKVHVASPWWFRWWAFVMYAMVFGGSIFGALTFQKAKYSRIQQETRLEAVEKDLALTGAVQTAFLPEASFMETDELRLSGFYRPAESCSGDWWWYEHREGSKCTVFVGDVTGHGPGPAMVTAAVATTFHVLQRDNTPLVAALEIVHDEVRRVGQSKYQMTMSALEIDTTTGKYNYYSAGGLPMLSLVPGQKPRSLPCRGTLLGSQEVKIGRIEGQFQPGERLLLMTDGIPEVALPNGRLLGMRRFARMADEVREMQVEQSLLALVKAADEVCTLQDDDWTLAVVEWKA